MGVQEGQCEEKQRNGDSRDMIINQLLHPCDCLKSFRWSSGKNMKRGSILELSVAETQRSSLGNASYTRRMAQTGTVPNLGSISNQL